MIDIMAFTSKNAMYGYELPWCESGNTYACDGWICIELTKQEDLKFHTVGKSRVEPLFKMFIDKGLEILPYKVEVQYKPCETCDGTGQIKVCPKCDGDGFYICDECNQDVKCKRCNETGIIKGVGDICEDCRGDKQDVVKASVKIPELDCYILNTQMNLIFALPNARICGKLDNKSPISFKFDGGRGLVMPCSGA